MSAKRKMTRGRQQRENKREQRLASQRPRYDLYLDKRKDEDAAVAALAERLLSRNKFSATARRGLLIDAALQEGDISVLLSYYPQVLDLVKAKLPPPEPPDIGALARAVADELALRGMAYKNEVPPLVASPGIKKLAGFDSIKMPVMIDDDDDIPAVVITKDKNAGGNASASFLDAAFGFQSKRVD